MYRSKLTLLETEQAIFKIKGYFQTLLSEKLDLQRVSSPLFLESCTGLNDTLHSCKKPLEFTLATNQQAEAVQSLAKWKRMILYKYDIPAHSGVYADMNGIRPCVEPDNTHSYYVDQWDWEKVIESSERNQEKLKEVVSVIYECFKETELFLYKEYPSLTYKLPDEITFITSQELENLYPNLSPKEREREIVRFCRSVFIIGIGCVLQSGKKHEERAPDYDDWNLNGHMLFYHEPLNMALEVVTMGIRVDKETLDTQLTIAEADDRRELAFHKMIFNDILPQSMGGGIGQSRMCMFLLEKIHIGEVQVSVWPENIIKTCAIDGIFLL